MRGRVSQAEFVRLPSAPGEPGLHSESPGREGVRGNDRHLSHSLQPTLLFRTGVGEMEGVAMFQKTQQFSLLCLECGGLQPPAGELACLSLRPGILHCAAMGEGYPDSFAGCEF